MALEPQAVDAGQRWLHDTGMIAVSSVDGGAYGLSLLGADGVRCSASLVFLALAEFEMLDASEDETLVGPVRVFRLAGRAGPHGA